ncbi:MAG TPA: biotin/lipoyl-containing protein [Bacteroidales bacterium]
MELEIKVDKRLAKVKLLSRNGNLIKVKVDDLVYDVDLCKVEESEYSVIHQGQSHNIEVIEGETSKRYIANTYFKSFDIEIIDAETRYQQNRNKGSLDQNENTISTPMPGKIVRIPVKLNQKVTAGETLIVVSAMKMESEYKVGRDATVKKILVKEGDTVKSNQPLIIIE